jgi:hypothetical protein
MARRQREQNGALQIARSVNYFVYQVTVGGTMAAPPEPTKSMTACDPRLTFTALDLADAKQPGARHEQPNYRQTQLRNECGPPLHELRR